MTDQEVINNIAKLGSKYIIELTKREKISIEQANRIQDIRIENEIILEE